MKILEEILSAKNGAAVKQLASQFGLRDAEAGAAVAKLLPALTQGIRRNAAAPTGAESLLRALSGGSHQRYLEDPSQLVSEATVQDGNGILGHILGSKDVSRQVAAQASEQTGIDVGKLKQMLPLVAAMAMGALGKAGAQSGSLDQGAAGGAGGGLGGLLGGMLDADGDGSVGDDLMGMVGKFLR